MKEYFPVVVQAVPQPDFHVYVYFSDGKITDYDMSPYLSKGIFQSLSELQIFMETCTVMNNTVAWDLGGNRDSCDCIDIDPFTLYDAPSINSEIA